jgi:hypothetical protein
MIHPRIRITPKTQFHQHDSFLAHGEKWLSNETEVSFRIRALAVERSHIHSSLKTHCEGIDMYQKDTIIPSHSHIHPEVGSLAWDLYTLCPENADNWKPRKPEPHRTVRPTRYHKINHAPFTITRRATQLKRPSTVILITQFQLHTSSAIEMVHLLLKITLSLESLSSILHWT